MKNKMRNATGGGEYVPFAMGKEMVTEKFPVDMEPKIRTMDKPLIVESACPGWQVGGTRFPAVPITLEDQIREQIESVKAGAIIVHVHPRDPKTGEAQLNHKLLARILDGVFAEVGDCIMFTQSYYPVRNAEVDYITGTRELLELGKGNKYVQGSLLVPIGHHTTGQPSYVSAKCTIDGVRWLNEHDVKPVYQLFDTQSHLGFKNYLFDRKVDSWQPHVLNIQAGKHDALVINQDPWSYFQLITNMNIIKENIPRSVIGIYPGGRNWLPMAVMGILLGADVVRVGIEDCFWMYPHKNEIIKKHSEVVKMTVELAKMLGRKVVTDAQSARKILGLRLTSRL
jgi:3-keto-5-aminohexanoate cleavage enzyme